MHHYYYQHRLDCNFKRDELDQYPALFDMWNVFTKKKPLDEAMRQSSRPELVFFLIAVSSPSDSSATRTAASLGRLDYLTALYERDYEWDERLCSVAAEGGHLNCLLFAKENGCPWDSFTLINAAANGYLDCLTYAYENGLQWDPEVCSAAAKHGHLACLQYAVAYGCTLREDVTSVAASEGHWECLQFALENGCPVHPHACGNAAHWGRLECLTLLHQHNAPWDESVPQAAVAGSLACLQYLIGELGMYMNVDGSLFVVAMKCANFKCVQYLVDMGCPMGGFVKGDELHCFDYETIFEVDDCTHDIWDSQMLRCVEYAVDHGWRWNDVFVEFLRRNKQELPTCWVRISEERLV
eukprot:gene10294-12045_t